MLGHALQSMFIFYRVFFRVGTDLLHYLACKGGAFSLIRVQVNSLIREFHHAKLPYKQVTNNNSSVDSYGSGSFKARTIQSFCFTPLSDLSSTIIATLSLCVTLGQTFQMPKSIYLSKLKNIKNICLVKNRGTFVLYQFFYSEYNIIKFSSF
ncbi:Hypothetical_protein [Hexamita inflata]|uniref:Hypothetical_protein n=1 Tax=Hexamita inflata TaxID=28002 RepID=A0ABP1J4H7_9EUKA